MAYRTHRKRRSGLPKVRSLAGRRKVRKVLHEFRVGKLRSGSKRGPKVRSRAQSLAIAMSEGRKAQRGERKRKRSRY